MQEFNHRVENGENLVILDEFVLDVSTFMWTHPGGRFSIKRNIGRDVSKFFHGGYSLENIAPVGPHEHSDLARKICNDLIIGYLEEKPLTRVMEITPNNYHANKLGTICTI